MMKDAFAEWLFLVDQPKQPLLPLQFNWMVEVFQLLSLVVVTILVTYLVTGDQV
jgi:hypothetical protein